MRCDLCADPIPSNTPFFIHDTRVSTRYHVICHERLHAMIEHTTGAPILCLHSPISEDKSHHAPLPSVLNAFRHQRLDHQHPVCRHDP